MIQDASITLSGLRPEIGLQKRGTEAGNHPQWVIHDPLQGSYFSIDENTHLLLSMWEEGITIEALAARAKNTAGLEIDEASLTKLQDFLRRSNLTVEDHADHWEELSRSRREKTPSTAKKVLHGHLFFKIPLLQPSKFLRATYPYLRFLHSSAILVGIFLLGIAGLYLALRNPSDLQRAFQETITFSNATSFLVALGFVKLAHEFGHAYSAVRYGCRVPTMGVALMIMVPVLYTDISDTWRLSKQQRMTVGASGIAVEIAVAMVATFLWVFMQDGHLRDAVFVVATTAWVLSLIVNLNPLMKFDGYYLLSDYLEIENLQSRAFEFGKWRLRQLLFAASLPAPEVVSPALQRFLVGYALLTWVYRLVIFTAIALAVYHLLFKALGIFVLALEVWLLIINPAIRELKNWKNVPQEYISNRRIARSFVSVLLVGFVLIFPWSSTIKIPAVLQAADLTRVYPPRTAIISDRQVSMGGFVTEGGTLFRLVAPQLESEIEAAKARSKEVRTRLAQTVSGSKDLDEVAVLKRQIISMNTSLGGLLKQKSELVVTAPITGHVVQMAKGLHQDRWVSRDTLLAVMTAQDQWIVRGYASQADILRIRANATGKFIPEDLTRASFRVSLVKLPKAAIVEIDIPELIEQNGGPVVAAKDSDGRLIPLRTLFPLSMEPNAFDEKPNQIIRGVVHLDASNESIAGKIWRNVRRVLLQESIF